MMGKKKLIPKRRIGEFTHDWEQQKLKEIAPLQRGFDLPKAQTINGPYPVVFSNGIGAWNAEYKVKGPGVVTGRSGSIGNVFFIKEDFWPHNTSLWVTNFMGNNPLFIYYLYEKIDLTKYGTGSGVPTLNRNDVHDSITSIPTVNEQKKIGEFFKVLDERIANQERKIAKVKALKSAYLTEMFPQEGETVPKRRFKGFEGAWETVKLKDIADIIGGATPSTSNKDYWNGKIDWYSPTEIGKHVYAKKSLKSITELGLQKCSATILPANRSILFTSRAGIGDMAILIKEGATNQGFQSLVLKEKIDVYFIYSMGYKIKKYALTNASGSTFLEISGKTLEKMDISLPLFEEQQRIGQFFKNLDEQITIEEKKVEKLKKMKEAYLEEMFV